ncbi:MAG: HNH endonuclease family protein, partial [Saprospiraceae bacterium]|nr:HNH endonuclease family protein [Saprospiraceae bacterium]
EIKMFKKKARSLQYDRAFFLNIFRNKSASFFPYIYRIGNFTLLETYKNKEADRKSFEEKKSIYQTSNYNLTTKTLVTDSWIPRSVIDRQRELAGRALAIWKINYLFPSE